MLGFAKSFLGALEVPNILFIVSENYILFIVSVHAEIDAIDDQILDILRGNVADTPDFDSMFQFGICSTHFHCHCNLQISSSQHLIPLSYSKDLNVAAVLIIGLAMFTLIFISAWINILVLGP